MQRLHSLIKKYNIGVNTLFEFLIANNYTGKLSLNSKLDNQFIQLLEENFHADLQNKLTSSTVDIPVSEDDRLCEEIKSLSINQTKRIPISAGQNISYKQIFGACFNGCKNINCIDPYIREKHQIKNLLNLIHLIKDNSINHIYFNLLTSYNKKQFPSKEEIESRLNAIKAEAEKYESDFEIFDMHLTFNFTIEEDKYYHDRHIYIDNKYVIDLTRGLDIFENYLDDSNSICKNCTIFITRLK